MQAVVAAQRRTPEQMMILLPFGLFGAVLTGFVAIAVVILLQP